MKYDAIIIGSGYGGLLTAHQLSHAGLKTLIIERGKAYQRKDFEHNWDPRYLTTLFDTTTSTSLLEIFRGSRILGGGSVMNDKVHHRAPKEIFDWVDDKTGKKAWGPINRHVLNPYYARLEKLLSIKQISWNDVSMIAGNFARMFHDNGLSCDRCTFNVGPGCVHCGFCEAGCRFRKGKLHLVSEIFHPALRTGNLTVKIETTVKNITKLKDGTYRVHCLKTGEHFNKESSDWADAPTVIVAAGPLGTIPLFYRSKKSLKKIPQALGKWMSNNGDMNFVVKTPDHYENHYGYKSATSSGVISYAFWDEHHITMHPGMTPVPAIAGIDVRRQNGLSWGLAHKHYIKENIIHKLIPVNAMGMIPAEMEMTINQSGMAIIKNPHTKALKDHSDKLYTLMNNLCKNVGGELLFTGPGDRKFDMGGNHIIGGMRMSEDPTTGGTDFTGMVHGHKGLYVSDCTSIPSCLGINPALTIGANALRIGENVLKSLGGQDGSA